MSTSNQNNTGEDEAENETQAENEAQQEAAEELDFTCSECGSDRLVVEQHQHTVTTYEQTVPCECGADPNNVAARKISHEQNLVTTQGDLEADHKIDWGKSEYETEPVEAGEVEVFCNECYQSALKRGENWDNAAPEENPGEEGDEFFVRCLGCRREVAFAWSWPDGTGLIYPVESRDFHSIKTWMDPRFDQSGSAE